MAIIGIILAAVAGAIVWWWRLQILREAYDEVSGAIGRAQGRRRMRKFREKVEGSTLAAVDDPALAAAIFLFALANENPEAAHLAKPAITQQMTKVVEAGQLEELVLYAEWAARDVADAKDLVRRFKPLWREKLSTDERADLVRMAQAIVGLTATATNNQHLTMTNLQDAVR